MILCAPTVIVSERNNVVIEDEHGTIWKVEAGDPCRASINTLASRGYQYIVLPRVYLQGHQPPESIQVEGIRGLRLRDCMEELSST